MEEIFVEFSLEDHLFVLELVGWMRRKVPIVLMAPEMIISEMMVTRKVAVTWLISID